MKRVRAKSYISKLFLYPQGLERQEYSFPIGAQQENQKRQCT